MLIPLMRRFATFYLVLVLVPLAVVLTGTVPPGQAGVWWVASMAAGFAGLSMMGAQAALTARFRAAALGPTDRIYLLHKYAGIVAGLLVLAHPVVLVVDEPERLVYLNPFEMPGYIVAGQVAVAAVLLVVATSIWRRVLHLSHEAWRVMHDVLAVAAVVLALVHVDGVRYYLGSPAKRAVWLAAAAAWIGFVVFTRVVRPWLLSRHPYRVAGVRRERGDAWTVTVVPDGHTGMTFQPGQFAWLTLGGSPFGLSDHPFSFSSSPGQKDGRLEFTIKELGDFTRTVGAVKPGTRAFVDGPYGGFTIDRHEAPGYVFIAGGIGIAPLLSMLKALGDGGDTRPHLLLHAGSCSARLTCLEAVEDVAARLTLTVVPVLTDPEAGWTGERGYLTRELLDRSLPQDRTARHYFICGPPAMIRAVRGHLTALGVPKARIHSELFDLF